MRRWLAVVVVALAPSVAGAAEINGLSGRWCWTASTGPVAGYEVFIKRGGGAYVNAGDAPGGAGGLCVTATGADAETIQLQVRGFSANKATFGPSSPESDVARFHGAIGAPGTPVLQ